MTTVLCIGSVLWDVIGHSPRPMAAGADRPGRILRQPGGVALNIAMALQRFGMSPALLSSVGCDPEGQDLIRVCSEKGLETSYLHRPGDLATDIYMAIEDPNGLIAAIADAHSLEKAGDSILAPLSDGRLGSAENPYEGTIALDGNLTTTLLDDIAHSPLFSRADLRVAPASPGKAERLRPFLSHHRATLYVNLEEAGILAQTKFSDSYTAAEALIDAGAQRVLVTDGPRTTCEGSKNGLIKQTPPQVTAQRITGAGDCFMAAHIAAELTGTNRESALTKALSTAAAHVAGDIA